MCSLHCIIDVELFSKHASLYRYKLWYLHRLWLLVAKPNQNQAVASAAQLNFSLSLGCLTSNKMETICLRTGYQI